MEKQSPGLYPVIYLRKGRKHGRYGWSEVPVLTRCGTADRYGSGTPTTSLPAHLDEQGWMDLTPATDDGPNDPVLL